jgi:hypothetical protein
VSRNEGKIESDGSLPVDASEILAALARDSTPEEQRRRDAISRYLAASEGWEKASSLLGGAFAPGRQGGES